MIGNKVIDKVRFPFESEEDFRKHLLSEMIEASPDYIVITDIKGNKSGESFEHIVNSSENIYLQIEEMYSIAEQLSVSTNQVLASAEEVSKITNTISSNMNIVAGSANEQIKALEGNMTVSQTLNNLAEELEELIIKFSNHDVKVRKK